MKQIGKSELVREISAQSGCTMKVAEAVFDNLVGKVKEHVLAGDTVTIKSFGTFHLKYVQGKKGIDWTTREPIQIAAHYEPSFKRSKNFKK